LVSVILIQSSNKYFQGKPTQLFLFIYALCLVMAHEPSSSLIVWNIVWFGWFICARAEPPTSDMCLDNYYFYVMPNALMICRNWNFIVLCVGCWFFPFRSSLDKYLSTSIIVGWYCLRAGSDDSRPSISTVLNLMNPKGVNNGEFILFFCFCCTSSSAVLLISNN
jgi:hypothetical protein